MMHSFGMMRSLVSHDAARLRCAIGIGLLWFYWFDVILFPGSGFYNAFLGRVVTLLSCVATLSGCVFVARRRGAAFPVLAYAVSAVALSGGTAMAFFGGSISSSYGVSAIASAVFGFGNGMCLFMFFRVVTCGKLADMRFVVAASMGVGLLLNLVCIPIMQASTVLFGCLESAFAVASIPLFLRAHSACERPAAKAGLLEKAPLRVSLLRVSFTMVTFGAMVGLGMRSIKGEYASALGATVVALAILAMALFELWSRTHFKVADILQCGKLCIVVAALSLLLQLVPGDNEALSTATLFASYVVFLAVMLIFYVTVSHYQTIHDPSVLVAVALVSDGFGVALGVALHILVTYIDSEIKTMVLFVAISFFMVAGVFLFNKQTLFPVDKKMGWVPDEKSNQIRCLQLAEEHGLTPRQKEIVLMLARGERVSYIADKLVLSQGTVRGHVNQIYRKLGVHSNAELIALVRDEAVERVEQI